MLMYSSYDSKPVHQFYQNEQTRLDSFKKWPFSFVIKPSNLSKAGFFYAGPGDVVTCFQCNGTLANWDPKDDPVISHAQSFPKCAYIINLAKDYFIPLNPHYENESKRLDSFHSWPLNYPQKPTDLSNAGFFYSGPGDTVTCFHCNGSLGKWVRDEDPIDEHLKSFPKCPFIKKIVQTKKKPIHPFYESQETRLDSFKKWPFYFRQKPNDLVRAGFFYSGPADTVTCFQCNGSLANWEPNENAVQEHFRSFPKCEYISQMIQHMPNNQKKIPQ